MKTGGCFEFNKPLKIYRKALDMLCKKRGIRYLGAIKRDGRKDSISRNGREMLLSLQEALKEPTDINIYGFVKAAIHGINEVFTLHFNLPEDKDSIHEKDCGLREYLSFENTEYLSSGNSKPSPGITLYMSINEFFNEQIRQYFDERRIVVWKKKDYSLEGRARDWLNRGNTVANVPENSKLCAMMDEPTIFLDLQNKFRFKNLVLEHTKKYEGRLQFFIATNDYALIKGLEGTCTYINLYNQPASSSRKFPLEGYSA
jgi:hypothetical protein